MDRLAHRGPTFPPSAVSQNDRIAWSRLDGAEHARGGLAKAETRTNATAALDLADNDRARPSSTTVNADAACDDLRRASMTGANPAMDNPEGASRPVAAKPVLLAGGIPEVAKADGDAPCRPTSRPRRAGNATSGAASTRSSVRACPTNGKAVKWRLRLLDGIEGQGWFLDLFIASRGTSAVFFRGTSLRPPPASASPAARRVGARTSTSTSRLLLDEELVATWIRQGIGAARAGPRSVPGRRPARAVRPRRAAPKAPDRRTWCGARQLLPSPPPSTRSGLPLEVASSAGTRHRLDERPRAGPPPSQGSGLRVQLIRSRAGARRPGRPTACRRSDCRGHADRLGRRAASSARHAA